MTKITREEAYDKVLDALTAWALKMPEEELGKLKATKEMLALIKLYLYTKG